MTGTVLDGNIDVALLKTDGDTIESFGSYTLAPYQESTVQLLRACVEAAQQWQFNGAEPAIFAQASEQIAIEQAHAVGELVSSASLSLSDIGVVGFHGQTVLHQPPAFDENGKRHGQTCQLGNGRLMAELLGVTVVNDFRSADMRAGGQGAPLCAIYHQALLKSQNLHSDVAVLNLGGVANLTWWDGQQQLIAFDTGPANAPINDFVQQCDLGKLDKDGVLAASGCVDEVNLQRLLDHPYFTSGYPKSLDRSGFTWQMAQGLSPADGAALLTAFCAAAVNKAIALLPQRPTKLIVCGGGRHNPTLMQALQQRTATTVKSAESVGWRGDALEAECFAYLAVRSKLGLPNSFPQTSGACKPISGGQLHSPPDTL